MRGNNEALVDPAEALQPDAMVILLIGASAVGKSTIAWNLCEDGIVEATPTWTTRPPRDGELDTSYDHHFVTDEKFDKHLRIGGFIDHKALYGARYGMPFLRRPPEGIEALMVLKPAFMTAALRHFPAARIYQIDASPDVLPERMKDRGQSQEDIDERMRHHNAETKAARRFAHMIFDNNGPLENTLVKVKAQIEADRQAHNVSPELTELQDPYRLTDTL